MKLLLDTHILLWALTDSPNLPGTARMMIENQENEIYFSIVSAWEIEIKHLKHPEIMTVNGGELFRYAEESGFYPVTVECRHIEYLEQLKREEKTLPHHDPFDRIMIAQAASEGMLLLTHDDRIREYTDPHILWL